ncbi:spore coat protein U domain-containing protein [Achromobacter spanius]|uniref:Csu type fimbrial protein n=1 Tax=Achromobacter spanius TaxID=217203 RepID=UPI0036EEF8AD
MKATTALFLLMAALLGLGGNAAQAQTCTASMTPLTFPNVNPVLGSSATQTGTLTVACNWGLLTLGYARVCVNLGIGSGSTAQDPRQMANGANRLQYRLSPSPSMSPLWGATATGTTPISIVFSRPLLGGQVTFNQPITGQILPAQYTVPTVNNATTAYTETFAGVATIDYGFYALTRPACSALGSRGSYNFTVRANVTNNCTISAAPLNFGAVADFKTARTANSALSVRCTNNDAYRIRLNGGQNGTVAQRYMRSNNGRLVRYELHTTAQRTVPWGDGTLGTAFVTGTGTGNPQQVQVYGRVPAQTAPQPGQYSDVVTATIEF